MVDELRPLDRAAVIRPNSESKVDLPMTDDAESVRRSLLMPRRGIYFYSGRLYDSLLFAISAFPSPRDRARRRAIVAITTDIEQHSKIKLDPLITELLEADTTLNEVVLSLGPTGGVAITCSPIPKIPCVNKLSGGEPDGKSIGPAIEATGGEAISGDLISERLPEIIRRIRQRY